MGNWFDIFRTGTHTDTKGRKHTVTVDNLKTIERKFNESNDDAPFTVGHPEDNSPAYGWLKRVRRVGEKLQGLAGEVVPEFAEAVRLRMYKKISPSLRPDLSIRHIAFLGGTPPAVKGNNPVPLSFSEEPDAFDIEFAEGDLNFSDSWFALSRLRTIGRMMQSMRDYILGKDGIEVADKVAPQSDIDWLKEEPPEEKPEVSTNSFTETEIPPETGKEEINMLEGKKTDTPGPEKSGDFSEKVTALETENAALRQDNERMKKEKIRNEVLNFVEGKLKGKVLPKHRFGIIELLVDLKEGSQEINFSEAEKKPAYDLVADFLESIPVQVPLKEVAGGADDKNVGGGSAEFSEVENVDPERLDLHLRAKALEAKEKIPYADAVRRLQKGGK
jgi:hypothetical protein